MTEKSSGTVKPSGLAHPENELETEPQVEYEKLLEYERTIINQPDSVHLDEAKETVNSFWKLMNLVYTYDATKNLDNLEIRRSTF